MPTCIAVHDLIKINIALCFLLALQHIHIIFALYLQTDYVEYTVIIPDTEQKEEAPDFV